MRPASPPLRALPRADKETLFAAAIARTVKGQLAFEHDARPELEATVARLGIDFAKHVRPTADMLWSRINKSRILDVARKTFGAAWTSARAKYKKAKLAEAMETAFAAGDTPVGLGATAHAAALAWAPPGFAAFDAGGSTGEDAGAQPAAEEPAEPADASEDATAKSEEKPRTTSVVESIESPAVAERRAAARARDATQGNGESTAVPEPAGAGNPQNPAGGNSHAVPAQAEGEAGPEPANGRGEGEASPAEPAIADAIDAMNAVPTADGGPASSCRPSVRSNGHKAGTMRWRSPSSCAESTDRPPSQEAPRRHTAARGRFRFRIV